METVNGAAARVMQLIRSSRVLFKSLEEDESWTSRLLRKATTAVGGEARPSNQDSDVGEIDVPYDIDAVIGFKTQNPWHSRCIEALKNATTGLGFEDDAVHEILDPLCETSLQDVISEITEDIAHTEMGYMEVVRSDPNGPIEGLYSIPVGAVRKIVEEDRVHHHFVVRITGAAKLPDQIFAAYGDKAGLLRRLSAGTANIRGEGRVASLPGSEEEISEVIQFRVPNSLSRHYGFPSWISAVAFVELVQMFVQYRFDFYFNRGVPELLLLFLGGNKIDQKDWSKLETAIKATIGPLNQHKTVALDISNTGEKEFQLHKLALDSLGAGTEVSDILDPLSLAVVSAHGVPPLLAGIQIPGKLGATNELPNALRAFQLLKAGPLQRLVASRVANTLANPRLNGGLPLTREHIFPRRGSDVDSGGDQTKRRRSTGFNTITDELDMQKVEVSSRMRQTEPEAAAEGRDLRAGLRE